jgi:hypothetical protein
LTLFANDRIWRIRLRKKKPKFEDGSILLAPLSGSRQNDLFRALEDAGFRVHDAVSETAFRSVLTEVSNPRDRFGSRILVVCEPEFAERYKLLVQRWNETTGITATFVDPPALPLSEALVDEWASHIH